MSRTLVLSIRPGEEITVTDDEATYLTSQGLVLTNNSADVNALLYGTPVYRGGTP